MNDLIINNSAEVSGEILINFTFSHECRGEDFYKTYVEVYGNNGNIDIVPVIVSDRLFDVVIAKDMVGKFVNIRGEFRSHNNNDSNGNKLDVFLFATDFSFSKKIYMMNKIYLDGYICKFSMQKKTQSGKEMICILLASNRKYKKTDYIPCVIWGRNARYISRLPIGTRVEIEGRIQSRKYVKRLEDGTKKTRIIYEVSVSCINKVKESED